MPIALAVHGGAGIIRRHSLSPERERACRDVLRAAVEAGATVLRAGGAALDACVEATAVLEDAPEFNAGSPSVRSVIVLWYASKCTTAVPACPMSFASTSSFPWSRVATTARASGCLSHSLCSISTTA